MLWKVHDNEKVVRAKTEEKYEEMQIKMEVVGLKTDIDSKSESGNDERSMEAIEGMTALSGLDL